MDRSCSTSAAPRCASVSSPSTATPAGGCGRASRTPPSRPTAERLYEHFCHDWRVRGVPVATGVSRPDVSRVNEGPVTLLLEA